MNPLTLLLGLLGAGLFSIAQSSSGETTTTLVTSPDPTSEDDVEDPIETNDPTPPADDSSDDDNDAPSPNDGSTADDGEADTPPVVDDRPTPDDNVPPLPPTNDTGDDDGDDPQEPPVVDDPQEPPVVDDPQEPPVADDDTPPVTGGDVTPPTAPDQSGDGTGDDGGDAPTFDTTGTVSVVAGRVATLDPSASDIASLRIVDGLNEGNVTVNPDGTLAVVMTQSEFVGNQAFSYEATHSDGSTSVHQVELNVTPPAQGAGWGTGESHYMLATDENDKVIVETGENHQKVYISGSDNALSIAEIAAQEGISAGEINGQWLANSAYGSSEGLALDSQAGMMLWKQVTPENSDTSNWLLLENGYDYDLERILEADTNGEDELHPLYIGSYGEGEKANVTSFQMIFQESSSNVVFQDLAFSGEVFILDAKNFIFDNVEATLPISAQRSEGITIRNSEFLDIRREESQNGGDWEQHLDRLSGFYSDETDGLLLEGNLFDHIAWADDYDPNLSGDGGQPPSQYSQNIYITHTLTDVTMRDTITMRAASYGAQVRSGAFVEDTVFLDNNAGFYSGGGNYNGAGPIGNYTLLSDNLITSGAHRVAPQIGALTQGINETAELSTYVDNIITHLADPNNPDELIAKEYKHSPFNNEEGELFYDDTIIYNWESGRSVRLNEERSDQNIEGLNTDQLDQTTIQLFTEQLLGIPDATINDLADYLRAQAKGAFDDVVDADLIIRFFQEGFGIAPDIRGDAETLRFVPDALGDGVRWDNRLNWDTDDLPGLFASDSVDLGGNDVVFGTNATINQVDLGPDGSLNIYGGRLNVDGGLIGDSGSLNIEGAGQLWVDGSSADDIDIDIESGRFVNTGDFSDADLTATGGQTILASENGRFEVSDSKTLAIFDSLAEVGFDGENGDLAILDLEEGATVAFKATDNDLGTIEEFDSGRFENSDVLSGIDLGNANLSIDLTGLSAQDGAAFTLMDADEITGVFNDAIVGGLGSKGATIVVDYQTDTVTLVLNDGGNGQVDVETVGEQSDVDSSSELWNALTLNQGVVAENTQASVDDEDLVLDPAA